MGTAHHYINIFCLVMCDNVYLVFNVVLLGRVQHVDYDYQLHREHFRNSQYVSLNNVSVRNHVAILQTLHCVIKYLEPRNKGAWQTALYLPPSRRVPS